MQWEKTVSGTGKIEYKARGKELYVLPSDVLLHDLALMAIVQESPSTTKVLRRVCSRLAQGDDG